MSDQAKHSRQQAKPSTDDVLPVHLIERLLSSDALQAFRLALEQLLQELPEGTQGYLWVRDGLSLFRLRALVGLSPEVLEGVEALPEATLRTAYPGTTGAWLAGEAYLDQQGHILQRLLGTLPSGLGPNGQEVANLTLPLVAEGQVWAVVHLHALASALGQAEAALAKRYFAGTALILHELYRCESAQRRSQWLSAINALLRFSHEQPLEQALQDALAEACRLAGAEGACLIAFEGRTARTWVQVGWGSSLPVETAITRHLGERLRKGQQVGIPRYDLYPHCRPGLVEAGLRSLFFLPILRQHGALSVLALFSSRPHSLPDVQAQEQLGDMAAAIAVVQTEWSLRRELAWAAYTDSLTGLGNRRAFERDLERLIGQSEGREVLLVLLDLDDFKSINDTYGHVHADHVLARLGGVLRSRVRAGDRAYRLGGDEFALVIEGLRNLEPARTAERYRSLVEGIRVSENLHLRVSLGYALYPTDGQDMEALWRAADDRMYRDKAWRKSRIPLFEPEGGADTWVGLPSIPLTRLLHRLSQNLGMGSQEWQVLQTSLYLLLLSRGTVMPNELRWPGRLLREAVGVLLQLQRGTDRQAPKLVQLLWIAQRLLEKGLGALREIGQEARSNLDPEVKEALRLLWQEDLEP
ncbi:sensor domain-containing diguanylate cyclase [Meiothermus rufus]|uniref:sensor domain-containing diguanylate cyclase n=1 Tax=Meiothermus rufus TaxID=604332 RepID=UPI000405A9D5|nr:sensor domain-containing diguanylate cyclase [Meiothermus rufus]